jgi:epoxyqueuosine reductase
MPISISEQLRKRAVSEGFSGMRIGSADASLKQAERLRSFLGLNYTATWRWLAETAERRAAPGALWPEAQSAIVFAMSYGQGLMLLNGWSGHQGSFPPMH